MCDAVTAVKFCTFFQTFVAFVAYDRKNKGEVISIWLRYLLGGEYLSWSCISAYNMEFALWIIIELYLSLVLHGNLFKATVTENYSSNEVMVHSVSQHGLGSSHVPLSNRSKREEVFQHLLWCKLINDHCCNKTAKNVLYVFFSIWCQADYKYLVWWWHFLLFRFLVELITKAVQNSDLKYSAE